MNYYLERERRYKQALWWIKLGAWVLPGQPNAKWLVSGFGPRSQRITDEAGARRWFLDRDCNLALVLGQCSKTTTYEQDFGLAHGFIVADFDQADAYHTWRAGAGVNCPPTRVERTARGYHVFFFTDDGLHWPSSTGPGLEFKTSGVVMLAPSVHPSGQVYEVLDDAPIVRLTRSAATDLFSLVSGSDVRPTDRSAFKSPSALLTGKGSNLVARIKAAWPVQAEAENVTPLHGRDEHRWGKCPFHDDHSASFWVDGKADVWGCHAPTCPTNQGGEKAHDVINLRAWARHISNGEAIRQLANELFPCEAVPREFHNSHMSAPDRDGQAAQVKGGMSHAHV